MAEYKFNEPRFHDANAAREHLESIRWPNGPICPHCGAVDRITKLQGKSHRPGLYDCGHCRDQFTVTVGTVFERSKVSLDKWLLAAALMAASKKGVSSKQIERMLGVTYKTAWFMTHRLREAMNTAPTGKLGGPGTPVQVDETYWGNVGKQAPGARGYAHKMKVVSLVEKNGNKRSFQVANVTAANLRPILVAHIEAKTHLMTDEAAVYTKIGPTFAQHSSVNHSAKEYARGDVNTNTAESSFAILKRGLYGTFHHVSEAHLQRYCTEFDFRWNHRERRVRTEKGSIKKWIMVGPNDEQRAAILLKGISNKRLTYRRINATA